MRVTLWLAVREDTSSGRNENNCSTSRNVIDQNIGSHFTTIFSAAKFKMADKREESTYDFYLISCRNLFSLSCLQLWSCKRAYCQHKNGRSSLSLLVSLHFLVLFSLSTGQSKRVYRVYERSNSRSRLGGLAWTLALSSTLNVLKFVMRVVESFL